MCGSVSPAQWVTEYRRGGLKGLKKSLGSRQCQQIERAAATGFGEKLAQYIPEQIIAPAVRVERGAFWTVSNLQIVIRQ